ncbi:MAG: DUF211 domain-containing protein [Candidatus Altiarchaeota archaeon]
MDEESECNSPVRLLVLDVLKPHKPNIVDFGKKLCREHKVDNAIISVYAVDEKTESLKMTIEGENIDFDRIKDLIEENGGAVHSIDKVMVGNKPPGPEKA